MEEDIDSILERATPNGIGRRCYLTWLFLITGQKAGERDLTGQEVRSTIWVQSLIVGQYNERVR